MICIPRMRMQIMMFMATMSIDRTLKTRTLPAFCRRRFVFIRPEEKRRNKFGDVKFL